jgi:hypothetical protein
MGLPRTVRMNVVRKRTLKATESLEMASKLKRSIKERIRRCSAFLPE